MMVAFRRGDVVDDVVEHTGAVDLSATGARESAVPPETKSSLSMDDYRFTRGVEKPRGKWTGEDSIVTSATVGQTPGGVGTVVLVHP